LLGLGIVYVGLKVKPDHAIGGGLACM
jgi:hypothetical protein